MALSNFSRVTSALNAEASSVQTSRTVSPSRCARSLRSRSCAFKVSLLSCKVLRRR